VYERRVDLSTLVVSLSSHRYSYTSLLFVSRIISSLNKKYVKFRTVRRQLDFNLSISASYISLHNRAQERVVSSIYDVLLELGKKKRCLFTYTHPDCNRVR